jgi:hypothetical protein
LSTVDAEGAIILDSEGDVDRGVSEIGIQMVAGFISQMCLQIRHACVRGASPEAYTLRVARKGSG